MLLSHLGKIGDNEGQKPNIFLKCGVKWCSIWVRFLAVLSCPLVPACRLSRDSGPAGRLALVLWSCVPLFCPLSRFVLGALSLNVALFRVFRGFLEGFMGFVWVCLACVLFVACVAFVRVWS